MPGLRSEALGAGLARRKERPSRWQQRLSVRGRCALASECSSLAVPVVQLRRELRRALSSKACRRQGLPSLRRTNVLDNAACSSSKAGRRARRAPLGSANNGNLAYLGPYLAQLIDEIMACLQRFFWY